MEEALRLLLTNAVLAGVLALAAWAVSRLTKRQAVVHGLWLLALLKLVTPPLVELPLLPATGDAAAATGRPAVAPEALLPAPGAPRRRAALAASAAAAGVAPRADRPAAAPPIDPRTAASRTSSGGESRAPAPADATATPGPRRASRAFRLALPALLALGALLVAGLATFRFLRFRRLAGEAEPAPPELAGRVAEIAEALGLRRVPSIALLPARVPPMLWPASPRPRLLLPRDFLPDLDADERDALLAHELAHVRRRDHWVRFLEVGATALFWWYPVAWWSRSALRRAEERCCDEWVVRALPGSARAYASGILKSLTFLAQEPVPLPETASGAGPVRDLESRLKEILMTSPRPRLSRPIRFALGAFAVGALALFPTVAPPRSVGAAAILVPAASDVPPQPAPPARPAPAAPAALTPPPAPPAAPVLAAPRPPLPGRPHPAPDAPPVLAGDDETPDPALERERRALEAERQQLHLSQLELERRALELEARAARQEAAAEAARLRAEGDAAAAARAEKQGELQVRRMELEKRQLDLQVRQVKLEAEAERAAEAGGSGQDAEARERATERAEAELETQQKAVEAEAEKLEREARALEAELRVHEARGAADDLAKSLAEQVEELRDALPEAGAEKAALEREIARLEAALSALRSERAPRGTKRPAAK